MTACLKPFDYREAITVNKAAKLATVAPRTVRAWCAAHGIGRRVGGTLRVSSVALAMYLEDDKEALAAYLAGCRDGAVLRYFERLNVPAQTRQQDILQDRQSRQG